MERLSEAVRSDKINRQVKKERSLTSKQELYMICSEKITDYIKEKSMISDNYSSSPSKKGRLTVPNVLSAIFEGLNRTYYDLQNSLMDSLQSL